MERFCPYCQSGIDARNRGGSIAVKCYGLADCVIPGAIIAGSSVCEGAEGGGVLEERSVIDEWSTEEEIED